MEKLDLKTFRERKEKLLEVLNNYIERLDADEEISEKEQKDIEDQYKEFLLFLSSHDLSDIGFKEWEGITLNFEEEYQRDFSKTRANLDFSIIEYGAVDVFPNFKGCNIKNFNFKETRYSPEMFDEDFIKENQQYFLDDSAPDELKKDYYSRHLSIEEYINNINWFKDKYIHEGHFGKNYIKEMSFVEMIRR